VNTCPLVPQAASPCPSAIGCASGECRAGLAGGRAHSGRRVCENLPAPLCPVKFTVVKDNAHFTGVAPADGTGASYLT